MNRAEMRRAARNDKKSKTATYNFTQEQLDAVIHEQIGEKMDELKKEATEEAVNIAMVLLLTLPLEVLMDYYWPKSYEKRIPGFVEHVLDYYRKWQDGEIDIEDLKEDLWNYAGIRLEAGKE